MTYNQLSLSPLSLTEDKAEMNTPGWKKEVDNLRRFYEIPANQFTSVDDFPKENGDECSRYGKDRSMV